MVGFYKNGKTIWHRQIIYARNPLIIVDDEATLLV